MRLSIHGLVQRFPSPDGGQATVLDRLDLETGAIRTLVLVGPSGGGKSTLLRILAGLGPRHPDIRRIVRLHVSLTHRDDDVLAAADALARILVRLTRPDR
ncbi:MAG: ATP-binding cassette domain-containing protein, partial [Planctomycetia bacterium]